MPPEATYARKLAVGWSQSYLSCSTYSTFSTECEDETNQGEGTKGTSMSLAVQYVPGSSNNNNNNNNQSF